MYNSNTSKLSTKGNDHAIGNEDKCVDEMIK